MKTSRRLFISGAAAASLPVSASKARSSSRLAELIAAHAAAIEEDGKAWALVGDLADSPSNAYDLPAVQIGKLLTGWNSDGEKTFKPIYAYRVEDIEKDAESRRPNNWARPGEPESPQYQAQLRSWQKAKEAKIAELRAQQEEVKRIEDASGYTQACETGERTKNAVIALEAQIITYVPASLEEVRQKARWCVAAWKNDRAYLWEKSTDEDLLLKAFETIAQAAVNLDA